MTEWTADDGDLDEEYDEEHDEEHDEEYDVKSAKLHGFTTFKKNYPLSRTSWLSRNETKYILSDGLIPK